MARISTINYFLGACLFVLIGCQGTDDLPTTSADTSNDGGKDDTPVDGETDSFEELNAGLSRDTDPDENPEDLKYLRDGNVKLGLDLLKEIAKKESGNLALSPYSIQNAFGMVYASARGQTKTEIAQVMGFLSDQMRVHTAMNSLDLALESRNLPESDYASPVILSTANRIFTRLDWPIGDEYLDILAVNYGAGIYLADFVNDPEGERIKINKWVEERTENRIRDLFPENAFLIRTAWVLVNALYFKAPWTTSFQASNTSDVFFTMLDNTEVRVPAMYEKYMEAEYADEDEYKLLDLTLRGQNLSVTFILPAKGTYAKFESDLTAQSLDAMIEKLTPGSVEVSLPKFKIETGSIPLDDYLKTLGMPTPFLVDIADFSGFAPDCPPSNIVSVQHSVFVAADEVGVEAAAATGIQGGDTGGMAPSGFYFDAHRPFLFIIRDKPTGLVLFVGRVMDPS